MATRFYFNTTPQTAQSQSTHTDWSAGNYSTFNRYYLETTATSGFSTLTNTITMAGGASACFGQWWSHPISNASSFTSADWNASTWTTLMRYSEAATGNDLVYKFQMRIWNGSTFINNSFFTGGTEFDVGNGATTNSLMEARRCSGCDYWGAIGPFSDGIRIVMEMGIFRLGAVASASTTAYCEIGGNSVTDLNNDQIDINQDNPWFESSLNFTFSAEPSGTASRMMLLGVG